MADKTKVFPKLDLAKMGDGESDHLARLQQREHGFLHFVGCGQGSGTGLNEDVAPAQILGGLGDVRINQQSAAAFDGQSRPLNSVH